MKRELKFRAWQDGQMLTSPINSNYGLQRFFGLLYEDAPIMQFTGIKDKNGCEIYEGDIMKWEQGVGVVVWFDDKYGIGSGEIDNYHAIDETDISELQEGEVIGNIYENKELITKTGA